MEIVVDKAGAVTVVKPVGRLDERSSKEFQKELGQLLEKGERWIVVDFESTETITGAAMRVLLRVRAKATFPDGGLILSGLNEQIGRAFEIARLDEKFSTVPGREEGVRLLLKELEMKSFSDEVSELLGRAEARAAASD